MDKKNEALKITRKIVELETEISIKKMEIEQLERDFDRLLYPKPAHQSSFFISHFGSSVDESIAKKVKWYFANHPSDEISINTIQAMLPETQPETLRSTLSRLVNKEKVIKNVGRGVYQYSNEGEKNISY